MQNFKGKNFKDIETAAETLIYTSLTSGTGKAPRLSLSVTEQQLMDIGIDEIIDKRNKEF